MLKKKLYNSIGWLSFALLLSSVGCKDKKIIDKCDLSYGGDIEGVFYKRPSPQDSIILPSGRKERGLYVADPDGLVIDNQTGAINVNRSLGGQKYRVKYVSLDNNQLCETSFIIGGIRYPDGIFDLSEGQTNSIPFYNANRQSRSPQGSDYDTPPPGVPSVRQIGIVLDANGIIDLKATIANGAIPKDQTTPTIITLYYQLNDRSSRALGSTTLHLYYFSSDDRIPPSLREEIKKREDEKRGGRLAQRLDHGPTVIAAKD
jgi:hypothetical protein